MSIEEIWVEYEQALRAFLHTRAQPSDIDDILQLTMLKAHNSLSRLNHKESLKSWLFSITKNTAIDFYRSRQKDQSFLAPELWYEEESDPPHDFEKCVLPFLTTLSKIDREVLFFVDIEGHSQKKYAEDFSVNYSTAKSRLKSARLRLKNRFESCCDFSLDPFGNVTDLKPRKNNCKSC
ncbi:MAG: sigma-70 family RNA polymerase sigma factor [Sneathiellales bacterium]|nr:sigma-70 family RNA polymerase sigma factor [Sneathiellales bacterium]